MVIETFALARVWTVRDCFRPARTTGCARVARTKSATEVRVGDGGMSVAVGVGVDGDGTSVAVAVTDKRALSMVSSPFPRYPRCAAGLVGMMPRPASSAALILLMTELPAARCVITTSAAGSVTLTTASWSQLIIAPTR